MKSKAVLYRMSTPEHICPYGLKSRALLKRKGYELEDHPLKTREATDAFKAEHNVETTPQTFIDGERIGGYSDLKAYFGEPLPNNDEPSYTPVIAIFATAFLMALGLQLSNPEPFTATGVAQTFIALSMCILAIQKLRDLRAFSMQFITYDLLAMHWVRYAYVYAFVEAYAGIGMLASLPAMLVGPPAIFIGLLGAISVIKAVYIDERELKCACVGGNSRVPLGAVSLTENLLMLCMGVWVFLQ
ncbi:MauE/DoxX family redox-associated membrane protein [Teredinibacter turnerae]|uniref:MauE/DoxX family redox-associated membrane protein n=1 Tax=Teredinibacter turnerae TaxID=2426 RepID=UPI000476219C|nr:MauE/DoxX family redox-associated membrane protein [Teredinibacter turnerae]